MTKQKKVVAVVSLLSIWLLNGCAAVIVGAGVGAGAYTYGQLQQVRKNAWRR